MGQALPRFLKPAAANNTTYSPIILQNGNLIYSEASSVGTGGGYNNIISGTGNFTLANATTFAFQSGVVSSINNIGTVTNASSSTTTGGIIGPNVTGVIQSGSGTWTLSATASTYTGFTTVSNGTLALAAATTVGTSGGLGVNSAVTVNGGILNLAGNATQIGSLAGTGGTIEFTSGTGVTLTDVQTTSTTFARRDGQQRHNNPRLHTQRPRRFARPFRREHVPRLDDGQRRHAFDHRRGHAWFRRLVVVGGEFLYNSSAGQTMGGLTVNAGGSNDRQRRAHTLALGALNSRASGGTVNFNSNTSGTITTSITNTERHPRRLGDGRRNRFRHEFDQCRRRQYRHPDQHRRLHQRHLGQRRQHDRDHEQRTILRLDHQQPALANSGAS